MIYQFALAVIFYFILRYLDAPIWASAGFSFTWILIIECIGLVNRK